MTTREVLVEARRILTPDGAWTQGALARTANGRPVQEGDDRAVCWCLLGAVSLAAGGASWNAADDVLRAHLCARPAAWNDTPGRTQAEVLGLLDRAIEGEGKA